MRNVILFLAFSVTAFGQCGILAYNPITHMLDCTGTASSGGTPGGSTTQCQYNNAGAFGGISGCTTDGTTVVLASPTLTGTVSVGPTLLRASDGALLSTDISTPSNPSAGTTLFYAKGGKWCSLDSSGSENCTGGGSPAFSALTGSTNSSAAMIVGTGASLGVSGSGTVNATSLGGSAAVLYAKLASPTFTGTVTMPSGQALIAPVLGAATGTSLATTSVIGNNDSGGTLLAQPSNTGLYHFGSNGRITSGSIANPAFITSARWDGTVGSPTAVQSGEQIGGYNSWAYDGATLIGPLGSFRCYANQNQSVGAGGTYCEVATTANGSVSLASAMRWQATGGVTVPSTVTGGDKGAGTLNATGLYQGNVQVATLSGTEALTNKTYNGNTFTAGTGVLTIAAAKTLTANSTLTIAGTDGITMTTPTTSFTAARTDAANTFTGVQTMTSPALTTPAITTSATLSNNGIAAVSTDGLVIQNTTAAAAGAQQWSPRVFHGIGQGWKTTATAASQQVEFYAEVVPIQSTTNPIGELRFTPIINGVTQTNGITSLCSPLANAVTGAGIQLDGSACSVGGVGTGFSHVNASSMFAVMANQTQRANWGVNGLYFSSNQGIGWGSGTQSNTNSGDIGFCRPAAGVVNVNDGTTTCTNTREILARSHGTGGTVPGISGCSAGTQTGGATGGTFSSGTTGACAVTLTFAFTAPTGWFCSASDRTTPANIYDQSASTTTTATLTGTTVSGDVIGFACMYY